MPIANRQCPWCGKIRVRPDLNYPQAGLSYLACSSCGVLFADAGHDRRDYRQYDYTQATNGKHSPPTEQPLEIGFDRNEQATYLLARFERAAGDRVRRSFSCLDVGCGPADFLAALKAKYQEADPAGIDPSEINVRDAWQRHNIQVHQGFWEHEHRGRYDIITMFGNLMLHKDPRLSLQVAYDRLKPGGVLIVDAKNPRSATRSLLRAIKPLFWDHRLVRKVYRQAFHGMPWGLPQRLVERTLRDVGFEVVGVRQLPGRNAALSFRPSLGLRASTALDRLVRRQPWIEFVARRPDENGISRADNRPLAA